jgi:iron complex transport system substrate-binding protein
MDSWGAAASSASGRDTDPMRRIHLIALLTLAASPVLAAGSPRIVSLNPCLDGILIRVADRGQILALSHYARQPQTSDIWAEASGFAITYETAEEVAALKPDLVLESLHTAPATQSALETLGIASVVIPVPGSIDESLAQVRQVAALAGHPERGEALIDDIRAALAAAAPPAGSPPVAALVLQPSGFAAGAGTLLDQMLTRTGFRNVGTRYGIADWGTVSLERVVADPPAILLADKPADGAMSFAERVISHPALASIAGRMKRAVFPERLMYCGGPAMIDSAAALAAARHLYEAGGS